MTCQQASVEALRAVLSDRERKAIEDSPFAHAAVLVPLFKKQEECHLLFTKRSEQVKYHKGQISFPGGVFEEKDGELVRTALRESFEEIGLKESDVQIIGVLDDIVTTTGFIVTPFVGLIPYPYPFRPSAREIAELIEVPLRHLLRKEVFSERRIVDGALDRVVYSYQFGQHDIWGATALILNQLLGLFSDPGVQR